MLNKEKEERYQAEIICMDELVPSDHLLRKIDKVIDFSRIYEFVEDLHCPNNGRPSVDPVVLFKMVLIQHLYGISSLRRTAEEVRMNIAYRWFLGYQLNQQTPHFSTVSYNFKHRYTSETIEKIFVWILDEINNAGYLSPEAVFVDGTHIKANANIKKTVKKAVPKAAKIYEEQLMKEINEDSKMYLCRSKYLNDDQEHLKCSTYAHDKNACTAHYIRTVVLKEIVLKELNKLLVTVKKNEDMFVREAMNSSAEKHFSEVKRARKMLAQAEKRISELDKLFTRLYEDNVSGKISDERFTIMSKDYEDEQSKLKQAVNEFTKFIETNEQKHTDVEQFLKIVRNRTEIKELTPEIMHEFIEKIVVHAPDKSSGHRQQKIDIYFRFNIAQASVIADTTDYDKKRKAA